MFEFSIEIESIKYMAEAAVQIAAFGFLGFLAWVWR